MGFVDEGLGETLKGQTDRIDKREERGIKIINKPPYSTVSF